MKDVKELCTDISVKEMQNVEGGSLVLGAIGVAGLLYAATCGLYYYYKNYVY